LHIKTSAIFETTENVKPLNEEEAIKVGSNLLTNAILYVISIGVITFKNQIYGSESDGKTDQKECSRELQKLYNDMGILKSLFFQEELKRSSGGIKASNK
jgi:hypothetical protein